MNKKEEIIKLLLSTKREGIKKLIEYLDLKGFFESPASTKFHLAEKGGLAKHSLSVYELFTDMIELFRLNVDEDSIIICSLLHDVCKVGAYHGDSKPYSWNINQPTGHAQLSINRIKRFIDLKSEEEEIIRYHMSYYSSKEFLPFKGEYNIKELCKGQNNKIVKLFYFCDDMSTQFLEE